MNALYRSRRTRNQVWMALSFISTIIGLGILTDDELNDPASSYMGVSRPRLICKSAAMDPNNRVETAYGKFDFFIDDLVLESQIGFQDGENSNVGNFSFKIIKSSQCK